jgi:hypothetical protein
MCEDGESEGHVLATDANKSSRLFATEEYIFRPVREP